MGQSPYQWKMKGTSSQTWGHWIGLREHLQESMFFVTINCRCFKRHEAEQLTFYYYLMGTHEVDQQK